MMLASGLVANSPNSASASAVFCSSVKYSGKFAKILPAKEMSLDSTLIPAVEAYF